MGVPGERLTPARGRGVENISGPIMLALWAAQPNNPDAHDHSTLKPGKTSQSPLTTYYQTQTELPFE